MKIEKYTPPPVAANEYHAEIELAPIATIHLAFDEIDDWLRNEATDDQRDDAGWFADDDNENHAANMFTSASDSVMGQIDAFGLRVNRAQTGLTITTYWPVKIDNIRHQFEGISAVTNLVHKSYEHTAPDITNYGPMLDDLSGDDDVDYSGSYIDIGIETIERYLTAKL
jgi:hypothetical protein